MDDGALKVVMVVHLLPRDEVLEQAVSQPWLDFFRASKKELLVKLSVLFFRELEKSLGVENHISVGVPADQVFVIREQLN